jgi:hypothetical protein
MSHRFTVAHPLTQRFEVVGPYCTFEFSKDLNRWLMTTTEGERFQIYDSGMYSLMEKTAYRCKFLRNTSCSFNISDLPWATLERFVIIDEDENLRVDLNQARLRVLE